MNIRIAEEKDFNAVKKIVRETIMEIYTIHHRTICWGWRNMKRTYWR